MEQRGGRPSPTTDSTAADTERARRPWSGRARRRRHLAVSIAAVLVVLVAVVAAGVAWLDDDDPESVRAGTDERDGPPSDLPVAFAGGIGGWPTLLATADHLVGYGDRGDGDPADLGQVVDLTSGEVWGLRRPETDPPFSPGAAVALDDELVVTGQICPAGTVSSDAIDPCTHLATYRVDPASASWVAVAPPAGTTHVTGLFATGSGAVGVFIDDRGNEGPHPLYRLETAGWRRLGQVPAAHPRCATDDELFSMVEATDSAWTMTATSFEDGSPRPVAVPDLPRGFGSAPFDLVCGREAPVVAMTDLDAGASVVRLVDGERWEEVDGVVAASDRPVARGIASGEVAVVVTGEVGPGVGPPGPAEVFAVRADGTTVPLDDDLGSTELVPRGVSGPFLAVGPTHEDLEPGVDEPPPRDPVPLRFLPSLD